MQNTAISYVLNTVKLVARGKERRTCGGGKQRFESNRQIFAAFITLALVQSSIATCASISAGDERCKEEKFESNRRLLLAASQSSGERPVWKQLLSYI